MINRLKKFNIAVYSHKEYINIKKVFKKYNIPCSMYKKQWIVDSIGQNRVMFFSPAFLARTNEVKFKLVPEKFMVKGLPILTLSGLHEFFAGKDNNIKEVSSNGCIHDIKEYVGFIESFKYCVKCDKRM